MSLGAVTASDLLTSLWINVVTSAVFLIFYAISKNLPFFFRVYYPRRYLKGQVEHVDDLVRSGDKKQYEVGWRSYRNILKWVKSVWRKLNLTDNSEFIERYGLDSAILLRTFLLGLKVFLPLTLWGFVVLIPVNKTDNELASFQSLQSNVTYTKVDNWSIAHVHDLSERLWAHLLASYLYTIWTCVLLYKEYSKIYKLRLDFIANQKRRPDDFTVLVRHVPEDNSMSVGEKIQGFFQENHPENYCTHQVLYDAKDLTKLVKKLEKFERELELINKQILRPLDLLKHWYHLWGAQVDAIQFYTDKIVRLKQEIKAERSKVLMNEKYVVRAGFVSFNTCWAAAVCAQTQQSRDHTKWVTEWAPEPRDVYWKSLSLGYMQLNGCRLIVNVIVVALIIFYFIPVTFVQSLANLDTLIKFFPILKPMIRWNIVRSFFQGYLPGLLLRIFNIFCLPPLLRILTKCEGHASYSKIDKYSALKYYVFMVVNVFFGNVLIGSLLEQLKQYVAAPTTIPKAFGISIPMKATFFMTYIMVDGWANNAAEICRFWPLLWYHRMRILPASPPDYTVTLTRLSLYFLLGLVYAVISPLILIFLCIINVYEPRYERAASYWPFIHRNIILALIIKHITLMGLFSLKRAFSALLLLPLPVLTVIFHVYCGQRFWPAFRNYPLEDAKCKDKMNGSIDIEDMLKTAYLHPAIRLASVDADSEYPDTIRDGTAPRGAHSRRSEAPSNDHVTVNLLSEKLSVTNPDISSIHINPEEDDFNNGSHGTSNHVHEDDFSTKFMEPGDPLSRGRSH
ncbi:hypothetical protein KC19_2G170300 [Ceratodon purpureus]|uniref:Uncharacterized protein n=1 Tax=Ceratodon purpureus TaxID=3225 RepID=A0A8T0IWC7_CERPU|nr:hypothetical protein KC19_2G170300 [Ceratodon purpureus]